MVDRSAELDPEARTVRAECLVPDASPVFEGHFPGHPLLPGALMIETIAQTGGWLVLSVLRFQRMPFLVQVKEAKMRAFVVPGQPDRRGAAGVTTARYGWFRQHTPPMGKVADAEITYRVVPFNDVARSDAGNRATCRPMGPFCMARSRDAPSRGSAWYPVWATGSTHWTALTREATSNRWWMQPALRPGGTPMVTLISTTDTQTRRPEADGGRRIGTCRRAGGIRRRRATPTICRAWT